MPKIKNAKEIQKYVLKNWKLDLFPVACNKVGPVRLDHCVIGLVRYLPTSLLKDGNICFMTNV